MRHRIVNDTGIGNPNPEQFSNNGDIQKSKFWDEFLDDAINTFPLIKEFKGFDYEICDHGFSFGIEPAYQWDKYLEIYIDFDNIDKSKIETGTAFGPYGSQIVKVSNSYGKYKYKSKFIKFVDTWKDRLCEEFKYKQE